MPAIPPVQGSSGSSQVYQQIEATAQYYPPFTYAQLLTFYDDLVIGADPASGQFMPLTTTSTTWGEQSILFAVGIIPPAANVTGRLLDRSASVVGDLGSSGVPSNTPGAPGTPPGGSIRDQISQLAQSYNGVGISSDPSKFVGLLASDQDGKLVNAGYFNNPNTSTCGLTVRGLWRQVGIQDPNLYGPYQPGTAISDPIGFAQKNGAFHGPGDIKNGTYQIQPGDSVLVQKPSNDGISHQHIYTVTGVNPDGSFTSIDGGQTVNGQQAIGQYNRTISVGSDGVLRDNNGLSTRDVVGVIDVSKLPVSGDNGSTNAITGDAGSSKNWQQSGSPNAQSAAQQQSALAGTPLLSSNTGQALLAAQQNAIKATQAAISKMQSTPPLALMINPASFSVKGEKIVNDGSWGRNGPIIEYWGDQQDKISGSGKVAGFFTIDMQNANGPGLTRWARNFSAAWQNFQSLFQLYRSNGALFLPDDTTNQMYQNLSMLGSIYIYYDNVLYIGSFDSFNVTESDTAPHTVEYSFEFTVRASFLLDRTDDAFDYGIPQITPGGAPPPTTSAATASLSQTLTTQPVAQPVNPLLGT